jgi:O-antigen ligase
MSRRLVVITFLAWIFLSHFFRLFLKLSMGGAAGKLATALPFLLLAAVLFGVLSNLSLSKGRLITNLNLLDLLLFAYGTLILLQMFNPCLPSLRMAFYGSYESGMWILLYFLSRILITRDMDATALIWVIATTCILGGLYALYAMHVGQAHIESEFAKRYRHDEAILTMRGVGTVSSSFALALMCALSFPSALFAYVRSRRLVVQIFMLVGFLSLGAGIIISGSRISMLSLPAVAGVYMVLLIFGTAGRYARRSSGTGAIFKYAAALGLLIGVFVYTLTAERLEYQAERVSSIVDYQDQSSVSVRFWLWRQLARYIASNPLGYGTGSLGMATDYYGPVLEDFTVADNQFIGVAVEFGIIGLALLAAIFAVQLLF